MIRGRKGEYRKEFAELVKRGFQRVKVDGTLLRAGSAADARQEDQARHRCRGGPRCREGRTRAAARRFTSRQRSKLADGIAIAEYADKKDKDGAPERIIFSAKFACPVSGFTIPEIEPRLFSFNNPYGACPACDGLGTELTFEADLIVPDESLSLKDGAVAPWSRTGATSPYYMQTLQAIARAYKVSINTPWKDLPKEVQKAVLFGTGDDEINFTYDDGMRTLQDQEAI